MTDIDHSGDLDYDRLTFQLETALLVMGTGRTAEMTAWLKYRIEQRLAQPAQVDDVDAILRRAAALRARVGEATR